MVYFNAKMLHFIPIFTKYFFLISALLLYQGGINFIEEVFIAIYFDHLDYLTFQNNPIDFAIFDGFVKFLLIFFEPVYSSKIL
jgi:hypothetical protein